VRLLHLSDLHLGFRQYQRVTPTGINQREADVAQAFRRAIDKTIALAPDAIVIAGDVFHTVRPSNPAILDAFAQFSRLTRALPRAAIVMIAGNHDMPRSTETGCILNLFASLGIRVASSAAQRFAFPEYDLSVLAVPNVSGPLPALTPDPEAKYNVLVIHAAIAEVLPVAASDADRGTPTIRAADLQAERFTYVALGHYHVCREVVAPNAWYAGSLDYTSRNPWREKAEEEESAERGTGAVPGKGIIERDLATGVQTFHPLAVPRELVDLPVIWGANKSAAELDALIRDRVGACRGGIEGKVVRLLVRDVPRHVVRELDHRALRDYQRQALSFQLDARRPDVARLTGQGAPGQRVSLEELLRRHIEQRALAGGADVDRGALVALGMRYLSEAESADAGMSTGALAAEPPLPFADIAPPPAAKRGGPRRGDAPPDAGDRP
jgi:DNA repair protein SbcD/Mre11